MNLRHGLGKCTWKANEQNLSGIKEVTWEKGSTYTGGWFENLYHNGGHHIDAKFEYKGNFDKGHKHGEGFADWKDGTSYKGGWLKSLYHGKGELVGKLFDYNGGFFNGKRHDQGGCIWKADEPNRSG